MQIKTVVGLLCVTAVFALGLKMSGMVKPTPTTDEDIDAALPLKEFVKFVDVMCGSDKPTQAESLDCVLDLYRTNRKHGFHSDEFYTQLFYWNELLSRLTDGRSPTKVADAVSEYKKNYSYNKYLKPVLTGANNVAATRADDFAYFNFAIAACISVIAFFVCRYTKPDQYALPMPNFYETSRTQRKSALFTNLQNYFHGPKLSDLPLAGGFAGRARKLSDTVYEETYHDFHIARTYYKVTNILA